MDLTLKQVEQVALRRGGGLRAQLQRAPLGLLRVQLQRALVRGDFCVFVSNLKRTFFAYVFISLKHVVTILSSTTLSRFRVQQKL